MEKERIYQAYDEAIELMAPHLLTLAVKRCQTAYKDDYGNERLDRWFKEVDYFIDNVLVRSGLVSEFLNESDVIGRTILEKSPEVLEVLADAKRNARHGIRGLVDHRVGVAISDGILKSDTGVEVDEYDGVGFEHFCASVLRDAGWDARVTKASGDQGVDIVANYGGVKVVFQCKRYGQPVGNAAVQEAFSGRSFERASYAVVVSNNSYTQSAKQLANAVGVHLIHHSDIRGLAGRLGLTSGGE